MTFMHDLAPPHNARSTRQYLQDKNIPLLEWPGNSPDINPIENMWAAVQSKMGQVIARNANELWAAVVSAWESIDLEEIRTLFRSVPRRVAEVIDHKGAQTHY